MKKVFFLLVLLLVLVSCTENQRAKKWGGSANVTVQDNYKVMNVTWKDNDLWILVRKMNQQDSAESYIFYEKSGWGILNGTFNIYENKTFKSTNNEKANSNSSYFSTTVVIDSSSRAIR